MFRIKVALLLPVVYSLAVTIQAQSPTIEYGDMTELRGMTKMFVDTKGDWELRNVIVTEIQKKLPQLQIFAKPEESDVHLRFYYEEVQIPSGWPYPGVGISRIPVGSVVKILSKDRERVYFGSKGFQPSSKVRFGWNKRYRPEIDFAQEFVKAYLKGAGNPASATQFVSHVGGAQLR